MRLENYITHGEYLDTINLAYRVKKKYGINAYFLFKKMCMLHLKKNCAYIIEKQLKSKEALLMPQ